MVAQEEAAWWVEQMAKMPRAMAGTAAQGVWVVWVVSSEAAAMQVEVAEGMVVVAIQAALVGPLGSVVVMAVRVVEVVMEAM